MVALAPARARGIPVNEKLVRDHAAAKTLGQAAGFEGLVRMGADIHAMGYALLAMDAQGIPPNISTAQIARRFANAQWPDMGTGPCRTVVRRIRTAASRLRRYRSECSPCICPMACVRSVMRSCAARRNGSASAEAKSTEDLSFRLLGLNWAARTGMRF